MPQGRQKNEFWEEAIGLCKTFGLDFYGILYSLASLDFPDKVFVSIIPVRYAVVFYPQVILRL